MLRPHRPFSIRSTDIASVRDVVLLSFWFHFSAYLTVAASSIALSIPFKLKGDIWSFGFDICLSAVINGLLWSAAYWGVIVLRWLLSRRARPRLAKSDTWTLWGAWAGITTVPVYLYADLIASLATAGNAVRSRSRRSRGHDHSLPVSLCHHFASACHIGSDVGTIGLQIPQSAEELQLHRPLNSSSGTDSCSSSTPAHARSPRRRQGASTASRQRSPDQHTGFDRDLRPPEQHRGPRSSVTQAGLAQAKRSRGAAV